MRNNSDETKTTTVNDQLKEKLIQEKNNYVTTRTSSLTRGIAEKILEQIKTQFELNDTGEALAILTLMFQQGGTARSCDGNMNIILFNKTIKLAEIRKILKALSFNRSERKLARTLANEIQEIALIMEVPGNLCHKIQKQDVERNFTIEEKTWLSDFQSDNEKCPTELRKLIQESFKKKKEEKTQKRSTGK